MHPSSSQLEKLHLFQIAFPGETSPVHLEKLHLDKLHLETPPLPNQSFARTKAHTTSQSHPVAEAFLHVLLFERLSVVIRGEERLPSVCPWVVLKERRVLPKEIPPEAQAPPEKVASETNQAPKRGGRARTVPFLMYRPPVHNPFREYCSWGSSDTISVQKGTRTTRF